MKKVLFLDFDGTLVTTVSGKTFPLNALDMKLVPGIITKNNVIYIQDI